VLSTGLGRGWNICFRVFSIFQSIGRKDNPKEGCRHRHKSRFGDLIKVIRPKMATMTSSPLPKRKKKHEKRAAQTQRLPQKFRMHTTAQEQLQIEMM
jgi:hypothetical protein